MTISIDIGTSNSSVFYLDGEGKPQPVNVSTGMSLFGGEYSLPSAIFVEKDGKILVGQAAINSRKKNPMSFCSEFKRCLGQSVPVVLDGRSLLPEEMYAELFRHLKARAEEAAGEAVDRALITYPASFGKAKREKIVSAAGAAGLFNVELIDEPTAAAMSYCAEGKIRDGQALLVYDFGGGTFDAALIRYQDGRFQAITDPMGLEHCGGIDIDRMIFEDMLEKAERHLEDAGLRRNKIAYMRFQAELSELAVKAKCHLSTADEFSDGFSAGMDYVEYTLALDKLNQLISALIYQSVECCRTLLSNADMDVSSLGGILLVGGTSRVRLVGRMVRQFAGSVPVLANTNPELAVAQGALCANTEAQQQPAPVQNEEKISNRTALQDAAGAEALLEANALLDKHTDNGEIPLEKSSKTVLEEGFTLYRKAADAGSTTAAALACALAKILEKPESSYAYYQSMSAHEPYAIVQKLSEMLAQPQTTENIRYVSAHVNEACLLAQTSPVPRCCSYLADAYVFLAAKAIVHEELSVAIRYLKQAQAIEPNNRVNEFMLLCVEKAYEPDNDGTEDVDGADEVLLLAFSAMATGLPDCYPCSAQNVAIIVEMMARYKNFTQNPAILCYKNTNWLGNEKSSFAFFADGVGFQNKGESPRFVKFANMSMDTAGLTPTLLTLGVDQYVHISFPGLADENKLGFALAFVLAKYFAWPY